MDNTEINTNTDPFLAHEALDRTSMLSDMVDNFLLSHPFVTSNPDVSELITTASDALAQAYQLIGRKPINSLQLIAELIGDQHDEE